MKSDLKSSKNKNLSYIGIEKKIKSLLILEHLKKTIIILSEFLLWLKIQMKFLWIRYQQKKKLKLMNNQDYSDKEDLNIFYHEDI